jgi:hypothetical protein
MTTQADRIQNAINHIKSSVDIDPWAMEIAVEAMRKELERSGQSENQDVTDINVGSTDVISRQAAIDGLGDMPKGDSEFDSGCRWQWKWDTEILQKLPSVQPEPDHFREFKKMIWRECDPDDPSSFPDDGKLVLMSFSNFPTPAIDWFERANDGGYWTDGNQRTLAELGLYVDGWWELPKKPERGLMARKKGQWLEKEIVVGEKAKVIEEWQSAKCSVCGRYHTTPYLYFFADYAYYPSCGAKMELTEPQNSTVASVYTTKGET